MPRTPSLQDTALDHLHVIRTLMERASLYRAVSAPAALLGGALSLGAALAGWPGDVAAENSIFLAGWIAVLLLTTVANLFLLTREAGGEGQPLVSDGLRMALRAIAPPLLTGGVLGVGLILDNQRALGALTWILCYGLALQATVSFAPRSIIRLARAFLVAGQAATILYFAGGHPGSFLDDRPLASALLGLTFGVFHLVYGTAVAFNRARPVESGLQRDGVSR
jgi:hypothetical protein